MPIVYRELFDDDWQVPEIWRYKAGLRLGASVVATPAADGVSARPASARTGPIATTVVPTVHRVGMLR